MTLGFGCGVVGFLPDGFESLEVFDALGGQEQGVDGAAAVLAGVGVHGSRMEWGRFARRVADGLSG
jgi:hypothetical protein